MLEQNEVAEAVTRIAKMALAEILRLLPQMSTNDTAKCYMATAAAFQIVFWNEYNNIAERIGEEIRRNHEERVKCG